MNFNQQTAGSADYIPYMVSLMEGVCKLEISRNESLFSNTSSNDGLSILDTILDLMCPNNCHNNGVCNKSMYRLIMCMKFLLT